MKLSKAEIDAIIAASPRTTVPFSKLVLSASYQARPRDSKSRLSIAELAASIKDSGVLQNLVVVKGAHGTHEVCAGGRRLDALIERTVPGVYKAVKWNTPFYGIEGEGWFLGFHCITKYVKVAFFRGTSLRPHPPVESKQKEVRYLHIHEGDKLDEAQFAAWVKQASQLPGERM